MSIDTTALILFIVSCSCQQALHLSHTPAVFPPRPLYHVATKLRFGPRPHFPRGNVRAEEPVGRHFESESQNGEPDLFRITTIEETAEEATTLSMNNADSAKKTAETLDKVLEDQKELLRLNSALQGEIADLKAKSNNAQLEKIDNLQSLSNTLSSSLSLDDSRNSKKNDMDPPLEVKISSDDEDMDAVDQQEKEIEKRLDDPAFREKMQKHLDRKTGELRRARQKEKRKEKKEKKKNEGRSTSAIPTSNSEKVQTRARSESITRKRVDKDGNRLVYPTTKSLPRGGVRDDWYNRYISDIDKASLTRGFFPFKIRNLNAAKKKLEDEGKDAEEADILEKALRSWLSAEMKMLPKATDDLFAQVEDIWRVGEVIFCRFRSHKAVQCLYSWSCNLNQQKPPPKEKRRILLWVVGQVEVKFKQLNLLKFQIMEELRAAGNGRSTESFKIDIDSRKQDYRMMRKSRRGPWAEADLKSRFVPNIDLSKFEPSEEINSGPGKMEAMAKPPRPPRNMGPPPPGDNNGSGRSRRDSKGGGGSGGGGGDGSHEGDRTRSHSRSQSRDNRKTSTPKGQGAASGSGLGARSKARECPPPPKKSSTSSSRSTNQENVRSSDQNYGYNWNKSRRAEEERHRRLQSARSPSLDTTTPAGTTKRTPDDLRNLIQGGTPDLRNKIQGINRIDAPDLGPQLKPRTLLPELRKENIDEFGQYRHPGNGGKQQKHFTWTDKHGMTRHMQVYVSPGTNPFEWVTDTNGKILVEESIAKDDAFAAKWGHRSILALNSHMEEDVAWTKYLEKEYEKQHGEFSYDSDCHFSDPESSVDSITRISAIERRKELEALKNAATVPLPPSQGAITRKGIEPLDVGSETVLTPSRKIAQAGRPSKLSLAAVNNGNDMTKYLTPSTSGTPKTTKPRPITPENTPKRKLESAEKVDGKRQKEEESEPEVVFTQTEEWLARNVYMLDDEDDDILDYPVVDCPKYPGGHEASTSQVNASTDSEDEPSTRIWKLMKSIVQREAQEHGYKCVKVRGKARLMTEVDLDDLDVNEKTLYLDLATCEDWDVHDQLSVIENCRMLSVKRGEKDTLGDELAGHLRSTRSYRKYEVKKEKLTAKIKRDKNRKNALARSKEEKESAKKEIKEAKAELKDAKADLHQDIMEEIDAAREENTGFRERQEANLDSMKPGAVKSLSEALVKAANTRERLLDSIEDDQLKRAAVDNIPQEKPKRKPKEQLTKKEKKAKKDEKEGWLKTDKRGRTITPEKRQKLTDKAKEKAKTTPEDPKKKNPKTPATNKGKGGVKSKSKGI